MAGSGCGETFFPLPDLPPEIGWVGAIAVDPEGAVLAGSRLAPASGAPTLELELDAPDGFGLLVLGFGAEDIEPPPGNADRIVPAARCSNPLHPRRVWAAGGDFTADAEHAPAVSVPWLNACAPDLASRIRADVRCARNYCPVQAVQAGCDLSLEQICSQGGFTGQAAGSRLCLESAGKACVAAPPVPGATAVLTCDGDCEVRFFVDSGAPWAQIERRRLIEHSTPFVPSLRNNATRPWANRVGYLPSMTLGDDGPIVVVSPEPRLSVDCAGLSSEWWNIDRLSMNVVRTATAPPCLRTLRRIPGRGEIFGIFGEGDRARVGAFDPAGRLLRDAPVLTPDGQGANNVRAFEYFPATQQLIVSLGLNDVSDAEGFLIALDPDTLASSVFFRKPNSRFTSLATDGALLAATNETNDIVQWFDATSRMLAEVQVPKTTTVNMGNLTYDPRSRLFIHSFPSDDAQVQSYRPSQIIGRAAIFDSPALPISTVVWPWDDALLLLGGSYQDESGGYHATLHRFSTAIDGVLVGPTDAGYGMVGEMEVDGDQIWALMPWSAELLRIRPAP